MAPERGLGPKRRNREAGTPAWMGLRARRGPGGLHAAGPRSAARPPRGRVRFAVRRILGQRRPRGGAESFPPPVRRNAAFLSPREMDLGADARHGFADSAATARTAGAGASIAHQAADNVWSHPARRARHTGRGRPLGGPQFGFAIFGQLWAIGVCERSAPQGLHAPRPPHDRGRHRDAPSLGRADAVHAPGSSRGARRPQMARPGLQ